MQRMLFLVQFKSYRRYIIPDLEYTIYVDYAPIYGITMDNGFYKRLLQNSMCSSFQFLKSNS